MAKPKRKTDVRFKIVRADERHRAEIDRLIRETRIGDGWGEGPIRNTWVVRADGRIVGCASLDFINDRACVLTHCAVEEEYRKNGIGSALVAKRLEFARERGCTVATLITMYYRFNFYKKRGFRTIPRAKLDTDIAGYSQFTAKRYMKCSVMINEDL